MAVGDPTEVLIQLGSIGRWVQAVGIVVILWIFFQVAAFIFNRKRTKEINQIKRDMVRIEGKIDKILKKR